MGIKKETKSLFGTSANYWRLSKWNIDFIQKRFLGELSLYPSKELRDKGNLPYEARQINLSEKNFFFTPADNVPEKVYEYIMKTDDFFKDAEVL